MSNAWRTRLWSIAVALTVASGVHAETVSYRLENVILSDGTQMTGTFLWTFDAGDFENGAGHFVVLDVPHTVHDQDDLNATIEVTQSIEITLPGSVHDDGVDITLVLAQALTPTTGSPIDLAESKYEIGGNGFHDGPFLSGTIAPEVDGDSDGVADHADNCTQVVNTDQRDTNGDGIGNACDADLDGDCAVNFLDLGAMKAVFFSADPDADLNGDGAVNFVDLGIMKQGFFADYAIDNPSGIANSCDGT